MFKSTDDKNFKEIETIIGPSVKVKGNFSTKGNIKIEGEVEGSIKTEGNLTVGRNAKITATVAANNAIVAGEIKGNVKIKGSLELEETAKVIGDLEAKEISVTKGAVINGRLVVGSTAGSEVAKPQARLAREEKEEE